MKNTRTPQLFIVGMARSGTTLLSEIFNSHSAISISHETHYFRNFWSIHKVLNSRNFPSFFERFIKSKAFAQFKFTEKERQDIEKELSASSDINHSLLLNTVFYKFAQKHKKKIWGEKTTDHLLYFKAISGLFPESKFVCIIRDPRDVYLSLKRVPFHTGNPVSIARRWKRYYKASHIYKRSFKTRFIEIRYEDLLLTTEKVLQEICNFLQVPFESNMVERSHRGTSTFDKTEEYWKVKALEPIDRNNYAKWMQSMTPGELLFFQWYLSRELRDCGYEVKPVRLDYKVCSEIFLFFFNWMIIITSNIVRKFFRKNTI